MWTLLPCGSEKHEGAKAPYFSRTLPKQGAFLISEHIQGVAGILSNMVFASMEGGEDMVRELDDKKLVRGRSHSILMENRERVTITGVQDVDSFDEGSVLLVTDLGYIALHGIDLHISKLNLEDGQLIVEGEIIGIEYNDHDGLGGKSGGFFKKLFR
jgi:sporulation protein YabP